MAECLACGYSLNLKPWIWIKFVIFRSAGGTSTQPRDTNEGKEGPTRVNQYLKKKKNDFIFSSSSSIQPSGSTALSP